MKENLLILFTIFTSLVGYAQFKDVKVGDVLQVNGVKGIVFTVNEDGSHGQMMSVKGFRAKKDLFCIKSSYLRDLSMTSETDGKQNTTELYSYCIESGINLVNFPVFYWCKSLGPGWYIPSISQLKSFVNYWVGNTDVELTWEEDDKEFDGEIDVISDSTQHTKIVNRILLDAGGIPFLNGVFSSTLDKNKKLDVFEYNKEDGKWLFKKVNPMKIDRFSVGRAFYDF